MKSDACTEGGGESTKRDKELMMERKSRESSFLRLSELPPCTPAKKEEGEDSTVKGEVCLYTWEKLRQRKRARNQRGEGSGEVLARSSRSRDQHQETPYRQFSLRNRHGNEVRTSEGQKKTRVCWFSTTYPDLSTLIYQDG